MSKVFSARIAAAASLSEAVDLEYTTLVAVIMPSAWTAADLTFQVSYNNVTFVDLYDAIGAEVALVVDASRCVSIPAISNTVPPVRYLKVRSGPSVAPVTQAAARVIALVGEY